MIPFKKILLNGPNYQVNDDYSSTPATFTATGEAGKTLEVKNLIIGFMSKDHSVLNYGGVFLTNGIVIKHNGVVFSNFAIHSLVDWLNAGAMLHPFGTHYIQICLDVHLQLTETDNVTVDVSDDLSHLEIHTFLLSGEEV